MSDFQHLLSQRTQSMQRNQIREILKVVSQPGMVSLAGGIPAEESFPIEAMYKINEAVLDRYGAAALQYDRTEGFAPFLEALAGYLAGKGITANPDELLVFNGSQNVLDTLGKVLLSPGDCIALESPSYLGALSAFGAYQPTYVSIASDEDGVLPEALESALERQAIKFIYLVTTFQNPTGRSMSRARRQQIADIIKRKNALVIEDDPYSDLRYHGEAVPALQTYAPDNTVYVSTLSKIFAPGLRLGFCLAPPLIREWLCTAKQGADLHSNSYAQALATEYICSGYINRQIPNIIALYAPRQAAMLEAMDAHIPAGYRWIKPEGGMFIWIEGPPDVDGEALYWRAVEQKVAFVPGKFFYIDPSEGLSTMRLNFTRVDEAAIKRAIATLGRVIREYSPD
ncbi:MAG: PLP-dependent aminotransferase family protein [Chloroflexi bacterium]|nr:PLP-dependent aminotransferase family protein [Chloroflexota bacterium]MYA93259.1 PLP-dependent aminotransferase family protein [Chloroflexota bacterium]MYD37848.1 PLP-dependent aminotransferase family protein [Chloroflexota bacterium]MYE79215.1 PLP-dependent aminotransferase family protein [Chloroflexota bacterium]MYH66392.1 PLP-dependent aminotransferase family protein [Chloroflexota bacterium]